MEEKLVIFDIVARSSFLLRKGLVYRKHEHVRISENSNSGYAGDRGDKKSTTGYCTFVGVKVVASSGGIGGGREGGG